MGSVDPNGKMPAARRARVERELRGLLELLTAKLKQDNPLVRCFITAAETLRQVEAAGETVQQLQIKVDERNEDGEADVDGTVDWSAQCAGDLYWLSPRDGRGRPRIGLSFICRAKRTYNVSGDVV